MLPSYLFYSTLKGKMRVASHLLFSLLLFLLLVFCSCKKLVEVDLPITSLTSESVYTMDITAISAITTMYINMSFSSMQHNADLKGIIVHAGIASDELALVQGVTDSRLLAYYTNDLHGDNVGSGFWENIYSTIYVINIALEHLPTGTLTPAVKQQLTGEAKFMRAFCYFYLVNLYGDVPLVLSTNYKENASLSRADKAEIYKQIVKDLTEAESLLSDHYLDGTLLKPSNERLRPTKWAATALLARVYLYMQEYGLAEEASTKLIENVSLFSIVDLNDVFLMNSEEAIWQLQPVTTFQNSNTGEGRLFILPDTGPDDDRKYYINDDLVNSFEPGDNRLKNWINSVSVTKQGITTVYHYAYKYKIGYADVPNTEYSMVLRLAEQYLIRAEARTRLGKITGANSASSDLNKLRNRAGLPLTSASNESDMLDAIGKERRVELFTEWGDRWLNMKRTGIIDDVMELITPQKGGAWKPHQALFPISTSELKADPFLVQNPGY